MVCQRPERIPATTRFMDAGLDSFAFRWASAAGSSAHKNPRTTESRSGQDGNQFKFFTNQFCHRRIWLFHAKLADWARHSRHADPNRQGVQTEIQY